MVCQHAPSALPGPNRIMCVPCVPLQPSAALQRCTRTPAHLITVAKQQLFDAICLQLTALGKKREKIFATSLGLWVSDVGRMPAQLAAKGFTCAAPRCLNRCGGRFKPTDRETR